MANLTRTAGDAPVTAGGDAPVDQGRLIAGRDRLNTEQMLLSILFGGDGDTNGSAMLGQNDLLMAAQLMSGFGPDSGDDAASDQGGQFG